MKIKTAEDFKNWERDREFTRKEAPVRLFREQCRKFAADDARRRWIAAMPPGASWK